MIRRLIAWFLRPMAPPQARQRQPTVDARDLDEFDRLLRTGKPEDLQKIARDLSRKSPEPISELRRWVDRY
jgi:class 3 adenylate cyclase